MALTTALLSYFLSVNLLAFATFGFDKHRARRKDWRISEARLLGLAVAGGSIGAWLGMKVFRHKTQHMKFRIGIPLILILQITIAMLCSCYREASIAPPNPVRSENNVGEFSPTTLIISYDAKTGKEELLKAVRDYGATLIYDYKFISAIAIRKPDAYTLDESIAFFRKVPGVISVERDHIIRLTDPVKPRPVLK